jgi:uncharacterized repeat protein (TIGR03803 family)
MKKNVLSQSCINHNGWLNQFFVVICFVFATALFANTLFAQTASPELIGMAQYGGLGEGTIFKVNPDGTDLRALYKFKGGEDGRIPYGSLIQASNGSLYGMTSSTIFKIKYDGTGHKVLHVFSYPTGTYAPGSLIQATDGMLYGMTYQGGFNGDGVIFRISMDGSGFTVIHHFKIENGGHPYGSLIQAKDGLLYGMALGGASSTGVVFKLNTDGSNYKVIHHFTASPGGAFGSLIQATNGSLYGMLGYGSDFSGGGAIFRINTDGSGFSFLHFFNYSDGIRPQNSLVQGPDGIIYGMTYDGGNFGRGTIVRIRPDGTNFTVLHHFDLVNGAHPAGIPIVYNNHLYGFTSSGGANNVGVVFKYNLGTGVYSNLAAFTQETGNYPWYGRLLLVYPPADIQTPAEQAQTITFSNVLAKTMSVSFTPGAGSKHLVVMKAGSPPTFQPVDNTSYTGSLGNGQTVVYNGTESSFDVTALRPDTEYYFTIFSYNTNGTTTKYLVANAPVARRRTRTADEKLFGMASTGGASMVGTIFKFDPDNTIGLSAIYNFKNVVGMNPMGSVTEGKDGFLYGMTQSGPINTAYGTIFRISPDGTNHTILRGLRNPDGIYPGGSLLQASNKALYGYAQEGGPGVGGTLFRINTDGTGFKVIHKFTSPEAWAPSGTPVQASNGMLYGVTRAGGANGAGVIFRINPDGSGFQILHDFNTQHERDSYGSLIQGSDGYLYGMTNGGSSEFPGSVFKIKMDGTSYTVLHQFTNFADGSPMGSLVQVPDGTLYGMVVGDATGTSPSGHGNIFTIKPDGSGYNIVHYFDGTNGSVPMGSLTFYNNKLFGFTWKGGVNAGGVLFSYDITTASYKKLYDLNRSSGTNPSSGNLILVNAPDQELNYVVSPANKSVYLPLKLDVTANLVPGATAYTIELNTDPAFGAATAIQSTGARKQTFSNLTPGTIYYNRVKTNVTPNWGETRQFMTGDMLTLAFVISPFNNAQNVSYAPVVEANAIEGATTYTIQLSTDQYFSTVDFERTGTSPKLNFSGLSPDTKYYSRVKTNLVPDSWGPVRSFTTGNPLSLSYIISPGNNATGVNTTTNVISNAVPSATQYTIQLSESPDFSTIAFQSTASSTTIKFTGLKYNTKYYNRVRTNLTTAFGAVRSFTTRTAESLAYVTSPANNATNVKTTSLYITSNPVPGATSYTIQLSETSTFSAIAFQKSGATRTLMFTGLKLNTKYYNRVLTNLTTVYGQVRTFTTTSSASAREATAEVDSENEVEQMNIHVYPNPFRDKLNFSIETEADEARVMLIDIRGQIHHDSYEKTNSMIELSPRGPVGVYFLKVNAGAGGKVVKVVKIE